MGPAIDRLGFIMFYSWYQSWGTPFPRCAKLCCEGNAFPWLCPAMAYWYRLYNFVYGYCIISCIYSNDFISTILFQWFHFWSLPIIWCLISYLLLCHCLFHPFSTSPSCFPQAHHPSRMALASASNTVPGEHGVPKTSNELSQWIGLRENLQETMVFTIKYKGFL